MSKTTKAPTMKDVAREAGVALGTVSKVFNGLPVGEEYKIKVEQAAKKLGYQVNVYARGLRANKTFTVAFVAPTLAHPFYSTLADHCCAILQKQGYRMIVATTDYNPDMEQKCIDMVQHNKVDGIIAITYNPNLEVSEDIPFIIIDRKFDSKVPCVSSDNFTGGQLAAEKLIENGCKKLLFLGNSSKVPGEADKRVLGFESYCIQKQANYEIYRTIETDGKPVPYEHVKQLIANNTFDYDGIFCNTDILAYSIIDLLKENNIRIPDDVQIIGYDGMKKLNSDKYICSTINQPLYEMANTAIDLLLNVDRKSSPALVCLPVTYCYGGTTKS